ncbi:glucosyltransferase domain-containing protein [Escherichia coli]
MNSYTNNDLSINPLSNKRSTIFYISLLTLCAIYVLPIILADRLYIDDILRSQTGQTRWFVNARPLADYVMEWMNFNGENIVDVSPLNLIISLLIFSYCSLLYFKKNMKQIAPLTSAFMMFLVLANPFMLENLSYKFDVLPMVISLSVLLLPFVFTENKALSSFISIACILASLCLYQASLGFFVILSIIEFIKISGDCKRSTVINSWVFVVLRVIQLLIAYAVYSKIADHYILGDYNIKHSQSVSFDADGLTNAYINAKTYAQKLHLYLSEVKYAVYATICATCIFIIKRSILIFKYNRFSALSILSLVVMVISIITVASFSFVHLSLLQYPVFADRVLISFGGVSLLYVWCYFSLSKNKIYTYALVIPMTIFCMVYSYSYGNALKHQKENDNYLSQSIAENISRLDPEVKKTVLTYGNQPSSRQRENAVKRFPSLNSLVPLYYTGGWWGTQLIKLYGVSNLVKGASDISQACIMKKEFENQTYQIFSDKNNLLITFERANCK